MKNTVRIIAAAVICVVIGSVFALTAFAENTAYEINELNMSIPIPNDMLVITRDSKKTDSFFSEFGLDYSETMDKLKEGNIYLEAMNSDSSLTLMVTKTETEESKSIGNYNSISDEELANIKEKLLEDKAYKSASVVEYKDIKYINLSMSHKEGKKTVQAQQYNTVFNGDNINITLQSAPGQKLSKTDKEMLASVVEGTAIIEENFFTKHGSLILYGSVTIFGIAVVVVVLIILLKKRGNPKRKHNDLVHELAHEHKISATTQIPRKTIFNVTKPTNSFLTNYAPIEELDAEKKPAQAPVPEKAEVAKAVSEPVEEEIPTKRIPLEEAQPVPEQAVSEETVVAEEGFDDVADYFDDDDDLYNEPEDIYAAQNYTSDYEEYEEDEEEEHYVREGSAAETAKKVFSAIGRGLVTFFTAVGRGIAFVAVHIKYFCINLSRMIKRSRAQKKRVKMEEERRRQASEQRRIQRDAERARRQRNLDRGENDLIKVHSSNERRRTPSRTAYPTRRSNYNRRG